MASTFFYVGGVVTSSKNVWKIEDTGAALSVSASYLVGNAGDDVTNIVQDNSGNIYVANDSSDSVYKYDSTFTLDTTWATSGVYSVGQAVSCLTVDPAGYVAIGTVLSTGVDVILLDDTGTLVWNDSTAPSGTEQVSFDASGNVYFAGGTGSGWAHVFKVDRAAPYNESTLYAASSGTRIGSGGKTFIADSYVVGVANKTAHNSVALRIFENDATVTKDTGSIATLGNAQSVYMPTSSVRHTDPFYVLGNANGTKTLYKLQYNSTTTLLSILASYDANNTIAAGNQMDFDISGNPYLASGAVVDEDSNTAKLRKFTSALVLSYFTNDAALGALKTISSGANTTPATQAPSTATKSYSRGLVTIANNEVWYESTAGTMTEITDANGDLDVSKPIDIVEAYEKAFIANDTNLKVADFGNIKITTANLGANPPDFNTVLTGGTSGAKMVVDYITTLTSACVLYGKSTTTATFQNSETVTGTDDDSNAISFTTSAAEASGPHWYTWTTFGNDSSYGVMPSQATIVSNYQGRLELKGDKYYPHQWYQSRQRNPWDWNYVSNDAQSPVRGNDADAGEIGDIIVAGISYKDDFMIHACANNIWYLAGNAAEGGTINELSLTAGILGKKAWCWDKRDDLYIMGTTGLLRIPRDFGTPENLTETTYPDFIKDLAFNSSIHAITMGYDRNRDGILISKTTLATGANSCWWYDFKTKGLFPETYPAACGFYTQFWYESIDPAYTGLLFGCTDGYIRIADEDAEDDDIGLTDTAISSYVTFGPLKLASESREGIIYSLVGFTAGGGSGGTEADSDDITYKIFSGRSAGDVAEKIEANVNPRVSGILQAPGRPLGRAKKRKVRGAYAGIRLENTTAAETMSIDRLIVNTQEKGKIK